MLCHRVFVPAVALPAIFGLSFTPSVRAAVLTIPGNYSTIQECIDAAVSGVDECLVSPGTYNELIDFLGKEIAVRSSTDAAATTINGGSNGRVVTCSSGEGPNTLLEGFTITGGFATSLGGAGMYISGSSPTVMGCIFHDNHTGFRGGGMWARNNSDPAVVSCVFS